MDAFFPAVEVLLHPEYAGKPLIVGADPKGRGVVSSCSYEARKYGVHSAMPIRTAYKLCPNGIFVKGTPGAYTEYSKKIKAVFLKYSPLIQMVSLDEAYIDMTGFERLYGDMHETAKRLQKDVKDTTGLSCAVGIAGCKVVAKVASDFKKPGGITNVLDKEREFLSPLPIRSLPSIGPKMQEALSSMGITTVGRIAALDKEVMEKLFGKFGICIWSYSNAIDNSKVKLSREVKSVGRERTFKEDVIEYDVVHKSLVYVLERALYDMRRKNIKARTVTLKLRYSDFNTVTRSKTIEIGDTFTHFYPIVKSLLDNVWQRNVRIRLIGIRFTSLSDALQSDLFDFNCELKRKKVDEKVDLIRNRYGFSIIKPATLIE